MVKGTSGGVTPCDEDEAEESEDETESGEADASGTAVTVVKDGGRVDGSVHDNDAAIGGVWRRRGDIWKGGGEVRMGVAAAEEEEENLTPEKEGGERGREERFPV